MSFDRKFLRRFNMEMSAVIIGWLWIIEAISLIVICSVALRKSYGDEESFYTALIIYGIINFIASSLLIFAMSRKLHIYLLPWLITNSIGIPLLGCSSIIFFYLGVYDRVSIVNMIAACAGCIITAGFGIYCFMYMLAVYKYLDKDSNTTIQPDEKKINVNI